MAWYEAPKPQPNHGYSGWLIAVVFALGVVVGYGLCLAVTNAAWRF